MELTSKQRAQLRGIANSIDTIVHVGKDGIRDNLFKQADDALEAREIIKCKVLENSEYSPREAAEALAKLCRAEVVQVIGTKFVLYRQSHTKAKEDRIVLLKDGARKPRSALPVEGAAVKAPVKAPAKAAVKPYSKAAKEAKAAKLAKEAKAKFFAKTYKPAPARPRKTPVD